VDFGVTIEALVEMPAEYGVPGFQLGRVADKACGMTANIPNALNTRGGDRREARGDKILDLAVDKTAKDEFAMGAGAGGGKRPRRFLEGLRRGLTPEIKAHEVLFEEEA
jgi:hypothetical protein